EGPFRNTTHGAPLDLVALCLPGVRSLEVWLGGNGTVPTYQWPDVKEAFWRDCRRLGVAVALGEQEAVPMLDFAAPSPSSPLRRPSIYLDTARTANPDCWFVYDLARVARALPDHDLLCTAQPPAAAPGIVDISHWTWTQRCHASEACEALVGTTLDPFVCTLTEANRWKPKALCGYDARLHAPFWDYPGNPMELLATMDELVDFLLANVAERSYP
ncbi:MAG: hypothetical protein ABIP94_15805, partial [Planctomycetota bacterium]